MPTFGNIHSWSGLRKGRYTQVSPCSGKGSGLKLSSFQPHIQIGRLSVGESRATASILDTTLNSVFESLAR